MMTRQHILIRVKINICVKLFRQTRGSVRLWDEQLPSSGPKDYNKYKFIQITQSCYYHWSGNAKSTSNAKWIFTTAEHAALLIPLGLKIYATTTIWDHFFHKEKQFMGAHRKSTRGVILCKVEQLSHLSTYTGQKKKNFLV